jgi:sterol carrier protein 2
MSRWRNTITTVLSGCANNRLSGQRTALWLLHKRTHASPSLAATSTEQQLQPEMDVRSQKPRKVYVIGVGMTKFEKPGRRDDFDYPDMARESVTKALQDARVDFTDIKQACVGYVYGDSTCGQRAVYGIGETGIPIYNVNNNCSTGSSALMLAKQLVEGGVSDCVLALGFEKMERGSLTSKYTDRTNPMDRHLEVMVNQVGFEAAPVAAQMFGSAGLEHMKKYGTKPEHFAKIAYKNHLHSVNNPYSQFQDKYTLEQILAAPKVYGPLTKLQCCPTSDGSAAAIIASEEFVRQRGLQDRAVEILGMEMATDLPSSFNEESCIKMVGFDMTKKASETLFSKTGLTPKDVDVIELHDCFATNELLTYEALGLCEVGKGGEMVDTNNNTYGGKYVVNPSGGLISKGHPLGATGLAQCAELCWQLRNEAGPRQVPGAKVALQHNLGLGGAAVVGLYRKGFPNERPRLVASPVNAKSSDFKVSSIFNEIASRIETEGAKYIDKIQTIFCFKIKNPAGTEGIWVVDAKNGKGAVHFGTAAANLKPDVTFIMNDDDAIEILHGKLDPQKAFFQGKLKITGSIAKAMKLKSFSTPLMGDMKSKL